jgi:translocation and assembly module TamB
VNDAEIYGESVKEIVGEVSFSPTRVTASHLSIVQNGAHANASGYYDLKTSEFQFTASGEDIELAQIHHLQTPKIHVAGKVTFKAEGIGTAHEPVINGSVQAAKLVLNGQSIGSIHLDAETRGDTLALTGHSNFERAQVDVSGTVRLRGDFPAEFKADFAEFNIAPFIPNHPEITTRMAGTIAANGRVRDLNSFNERARDQANE